MLEINLAYMKTLQEQSKETEFNQTLSELASLFDEDKKSAYVPTPEAREAEDLLKKASLTLTLDEYQKLQEQSQETEFNQAHFELAELFDEDKKISLYPYF